MTEHPRSLGTAAAPATAAAAPSAPSMQGLAGESSLVSWTAVQDLQLTVVVEIGRARLSLAELTRLKPGDVVELDSAASQPVNLLVQGRLVARGEIVIVGDRHGICLIDILCD